MWGGALGGKGPQGWGPVPQAAHPDACLQKIHWAASRQRIEECVLSGKDGNVSVVGPQVGWGGGQVTPGRHLGTSLAFPLAPG